MHLLHSLGCAAAVQQGLGEKLYFTPSVLKIHSLTCSEQQTSHDGEGQASDHQDEVSSHLSPLLLLIKTEAGDKVLDVFIRFFIRQEKDGEIKTEAPPTNEKLDTLIFSTS